MYVSYRIEYPGAPVQWNPGRIRWKRIFCYGFLCFGFWLLGVSVFWEEGRRVLMDWCYPGNALVTRQALIRMAGQLRTGTSLEDAAMVFCREILGIG